MKYSLQEAQKYLKERPGINEADIDTQVYAVGTTVSEVMYTLVAVSQWEHTLTFVGYL